MRFYVESLVGQKKLKFFSAPVSSVDWRNINYSEILGILIFFTFSVFLIFGTFSGAISWRHFPYVPGRFRPFLAGPTFVLIFCRARARARARARSRSWPKKCMSNFYTNMKKNHFFLQYDFFIFWENPSGKSFFPTKKLGKCKKMDFWNIFSILEKSLFSHPVGEILQM